MLSDTKEIKILIVEDDRISFEYLKEILKEEGAKILLAKTGIEAVLICNEDPDIDLVFMDIKMPEMDGREATKRIKVFRPKLPIIAQTAYALDDERETILKDGFDDYLSKPIQRNEMQVILNKYLH
ncbi:MAG: response regulator [Candidatus Marinimicrobia bacterium]|nr:response regulator [Candidatus Neomarinimicrobiota bacterium]